MYINTTFGKNRGSKIAKIKTPKLSMNRNKYTVRCIYNCTIIRIRL